MNSYAIRIAVCLASMSSVLAALIAIASTCPAQAQLKADFIDGTYVFTPDGCDKLKALAAGGTAGVMTQPWSVSADGISFWEGGCGFSKIKKRGDEQWHVTAACEENGDEYVESYVFKRTSKSTFAVSLTTRNASADQRLPKTYTRCIILPAAPKAEGN